MAKMQQVVPVIEEPTTLVLPRSHVRERLLTRIEEGRKALEVAPRTAEQLRTVEETTDRWHKYNKDLLATLLTGKALQEYGNSGCTWVTMSGRLEDRVGSWTREHKGRVDCLESILERLDLFPEPELALSPNTANHHDKAPRPSTVFVVHGHDVKTRESVARFLERLGMEAVILHEQPNQGRTVIEKFEAHAEVGFAVVLLTRDDLGYSKEEGSSALQPRARQNVIFELGYFVGKLGRSRVAALYEEGVEPPSDILGLVYTLLDDQGMWQLRLGKELKAAGYTIDLNRLA